ncbi:MAG: helix-turn-helix transcriptional regulator [Clostridia bacterium]|nr:helix-turn-helix transcriptional regulator [Clostridia bacterium]
MMYELAVKSNVYNMLICLFRRCVFKGSPFRQLVENAERHDRIKPALDIMKSKLSEHISLEEPADACHLSSHFCRLFRQITGCSPTQLKNSQ